MKILEYDASFGEIAFPEGFEKELEGRSVEEQLRCFALTEYAGLTKVPYEELEQKIRGSRIYLEGTTPIPERWYVVVKNGTVVGVAWDRLEYDEVTREFNAVGQKVLLPYERYVCGSTSDNNGSGYKTRDWYNYLVCLPFDHTLW